MVSSFSTSRSGLHHAAEHGDLNILSALLETQADSQKKEEAEGGYELLILYKDVFPFDYMTVKVKI